MRRSLLLVHGFAQTPAMWDDVAASLGHVDTRAVEIAVGLGFGATTELLGARYGEGTWCGYSMGGRLALRLALDLPEHVERLVLVSATAGIDDEVERAARRAADERLAARIEAIGTAAFLDEWLAQPMFAGVPRDAAGREDRNRLRGRTLAAWLRDLGTGVMEAMWSQLHELEMPVLVVHGTRDDKYTEIAQRLTNAIPNARRVGIDCGHAVPLEAPRELARVLHEFHSPTDTSTASVS
jgi:2-succinyl-6-hydroxy-2,4-cyclohexadiene-1-carboxylate synthase